MSEKMKKALLETAKKFAFKDIFCDESGDRYCL